MPSTISSIVHTEETTLPITLNPSYGDVLRRSCEAEVRSAATIYRFLNATGTSDKAWNLENCRESAWFSRNVDTGELRVASKTCHLRWCPLCADSRRNYISFEVKKWVETLSHPKFLTLTLKHTDTPLSWQIDKLYQSFRTIRRRKYFNDLVTGGIWFFQVKKSKTDGRWHPHLHCLIGGKYIPRKWLSLQWSEVTHGSTVVDIRPIKDSNKACNDAARYAACPGSLSGLSLQDGVELVESMIGRRIVGTWGTAKVVSLRPPKAEKDGKWENIGSWFSVMGNRDHDPNARAIAYAYYNNQTLPKGIDVTYIDMRLTGAHHIDLTNYDLDTMYPDERSPPCES